MSKQKFKRLTKQKEEISLPTGFRLEEDLERAFLKMEHSTQNIFLTGNAGTGKSSLLNYFRKNSAKNYIVLAPTGIAAVNIGGVTIHSFFGFPIRTMKPQDPDIKKWGKNNYKLELLKQTDVIIIDEASMVRADILDAIDYALQVQMDTQMRFGGKQMILIGDVYQLNPIESTTEILDDPEVMKSYKSIYFFSADAFKNGHFHVIELQKIYRQADETFVSLLNKIRKNEVGLSDLKLLNNRYITSESLDHELHITLASTNKITYEVNINKLDRLKGKEYIYWGVTEGVFPDYMKIVETELVVKKGAQIMMVNNDLEGKWINGSLATVLEANENQIRIKLENGGTQWVDPVTWENVIFRWDKTTHEIVKDVRGTFKQYPIKLAWAITIHKSQGLTFDKVIIDVGSGAFAHGQIYVALSRCKSFEGIYLKTQIKPSDIKVDPIVNVFQDWYRKKFMSNMQ